MQVPLAPDGDRSDAWEGQFYAALMLVAAAALWLPLLSRSLELDETVTQWVVGGQAGSVVRRSMEFQFSPLAFLPQALSHSLAGGEVSLRAPSVIFGLLAALMLGRLARDAGDAVVAGLAGLFMVTLPEVGQAATQARPYALCLVFVTGAVLGLLRWLERGSVGSGLFYALCAGLAPHVHPLMATGYLVHAVQVSWHLRSGRHLPRDWPRVLAVLAAFGVLMVPELLSLYARRGLLSYAPTPSVVDLLEGIVFPGTSGAFMIGLAAVVALGARLSSSRPGWEGLVRLGCVWAVTPPACLFVVARLSAFKVYVPHYASVALPGFALLLAGLARQVVPRQARMALAALVVLLVGLGVPRPNHREDWRGAARAAAPFLGPEAPLVLISGLVESAAIEWLTSPERRSYLNAPQEAYLPGARTLTLPSRIATPEISAYVDGLVDELRASRRFVLMTRADGRDVQRFLEARLAGSGFRPRPLGPVEGVYLSLFERGS